MNLSLQPFTESRTPAKDKRIFTPDKFDCSFGKDIYCARRHNRHGPNPCILIA